MKKILSFLAFIFAFLLSFNAAFAENFYIENYNVVMNVHEDKSVDVIEDIYVNFTTSSHGIFRTIPMSGGWIDKISVNGHHMTSEEGNQIKIKIGNPNVYVSGNKHYQIRYTHHLQGNSYEFYYNIIGTEWPVEIKKVTFSVNMPKGFDASKAGLSIGRFGTAGFNGGAEFVVNNTNISGSTTTRVLDPGEGITLRIGLPNGYFDIKQNPLKKTVSYLMLGLTFLAVLIWYTYGKDDHVTPVVNFYPPKGLNSAEVEVLYSGKASEKGLTSLIVWLANAGYLEITNEGHDFTITKIKEYDGNNEYVKEFLSYLIPYGNYVTAKTLEFSRTFYKDCGNLILKLDKIKDLIFYKNSISGHLKFFMGLISFLLVVLELFTLFNYSIFRIFSVGPLALFPTIAIVFVTAILLGSGSFISKIPILIFFAIWGGVPGLLLISQSLTNGDSFNITLGLICIIVAIICTYHLPKRNSLGNRYLGELLGFKKFLETVELSRVESLVNQNPNYCFDVLPYLYLFGLSEKWINKFEKLFKEPPQWYHGSSFGHNFHNFTTVASSCTQPSTSNGGVSHSSSGGGGGSCGGGGGGGGGGSW